jgi:glutathione-regulated potassium-efflux system ancillary protein KefF
LITLIHAHPQADRSVGGRALLEAVRDLPDLVVRPLYDLYPDFAIDVESERAALAGTRLLIWQHPLHWYGVPALLKLWFDDVLTEGWAFGSRRALSGIDCLWVTTTGGGPDAFSPSGRHAHPFEAFVAPVAQTARFCGMNFLAPVVVYGARSLAPAELDRHARAYRDVLTTWRVTRG